MIEPRDRRGFVVIEAIIALVVIAVTAASLLGAVVNARHVADLARARENDVSLAHHRLALISATWVTSDFRKHTGAYADGRLVRQVTLLDLDKYQVSFFPVSSSAPLLSTIFTPSSDRGDP